MALIETNKRLYELDFNPQLDIYEDKSPFYKNQRSTEEYYCSCKCNAGFSNWSQWKHHCGLKVHQDYKKNYKFFNKPLLDCRGLVIDLKRENNLSMNKYRKLKIKYSEKKNELTELENKMNDTKNLQKEYDILKKENEQLKKELEEIDTVEISDSEEDYDECLQI